MSETVNVENVIKIYEVLIKLSTLADKYNELVNTYRDLISKEIEIKLPQLGTIPVEPRKLKELRPLPVPVCVETDETFNAIHFGKKICLRFVGAFANDIKCYSRMTIANLIEMTCNIADVLEKTANDIDQYVNVLPKIIETLKTIVAESKLLS
jgi:hypothetical protein